MRAVFLEKWRRTSPKEEDAAYRCGQCMDHYRDALSLELLRARLPAKPGGSLTPLARYHGTGSPTKQAGATKDVGGNILRVLAP